MDGASKEDAAGKHEDASEQSKTPKLGAKWGLVKHKMVEPARFVTPPQRLHSCSLCFAKRFFWIKKEKEEKEDERTGMQGSSFFSFDPPPLPVSARRSRTTACSQT